MPCGIRNPKVPCRGIRNLNHSIGEREELKRTMKAKAGLEKMARDRKKMADKRSLNINRRNRKQKQSTKDVLERRDNNPYLAACKIRIWEEMSGTPIAPRGANKRNREFTGAISRILQRADKDIQEEKSAPRGARNKGKKSGTRRVSGKKHTQKRSRRTRGVKNHRPTP